MKKDIWYHICYDTHGDGFQPADFPFAYVCGVKELEDAISRLITEDGYEKEDLIIFEITNKKIKTKTIKTVETVEVKKTIVEIK